MEDNNGKITTKNNRILWIDAVRGITILSMIAYHAMWDYVWLYGHDLSWYKGTVGYVWQQSICISFILLAGFCRPFAKHPIRKGLILIGCSLAISIITGIVEPDSQVHFGVLSLIGTGMILFTLPERIPMMKEGKKEHTGWFILLMAASAILFLLTRDINHGMLGFYGIDFVKTPRILYQNWITTYLGFPFAGFRSSDYFSVLPWIFLFGTGYFGKKIYDIRCRSRESGTPQSARQESRTRGCLAPVRWLGRKSLPVYLIHQPLIMLVFFIIYRK